jgi:hypothetical protein
MLKLVHHLLPLATNQDWFPIILWSQKVALFLVLIAVIIVIMMRSFQGRENRADRLFCCVATL